MIPTDFEINIEDAFDNLSSTEQLVKYVFDNLSEFERKIFLTYIAANCPDLIQFIKDY